MSVEILDYSRWADFHKKQAAEILRAAFAHSPSDWSDINRCIRDVAEFSDQKSRTAIGLVRGAEMLGWIGAIHQHSHSWELHPLAVRPDLHRRGYGARLVRALEERAAAAGILTLWLLSDDDFGGTNLYGVDLYPNLLASLAHIQATSGHPFEFYQKCGFSLAGVIPDASGKGRPDILMAKRIA